MKRNPKIVGRSALVKIVQRLRKDGKTIAFTNGCFDILHYGHVSYLQQAKKGNRVLIIGLNSDASTRRLKGPGRPINPEKTRGEVLGALACVDYVTVFGEDTPHKLIRALQPDVLIKGADWKGKEVIGSDVVLARGGRVEFVRYEDHFSTTGTIRKIMRQRGR